LGVVGFFSSPRADHRSLLKNDRLTKFNVCHWLCQ
jgi:hypothetical protein